MSLHVLQSGFLAVKPKYAVHGGRLIARSGLAAQILTLFSKHRTVIADPRRQLVEIRQRFLWFFTKRREIPFERIVRIHYQYGSANTSWRLGEALDAVEWFNVTLVLEAPKERVRLWKFFGEGAVQTGMSGVLLRGDDWIDHCGDQEESSRRYVDLLREMTQKELV